MENTEDMTEYSTDFLNALTTGDDDALDEAIDHIGGPRSVALASSLLALFIREVLGASFELEDIAEYAKRISSDLQTGTRRIAVEDVLRTGAGFENVLSGLDDDERLEAAADVIRYISDDLRTRSVPLQPIIQDAVRLAASQDYGLPTTD